MKSGTIDRRIKYTKFQLKTALTQIMKTKPIYEITVKELCEKADINRSTFYSHYDNPAQIYNEMTKNIFSEIRTIVKKCILDGEISKEQMLIEIFGYCEQNRDICLVVLSDKSIITVGQTLDKVIDSFCDEFGLTEMNSGDPLEVNRYLSLFVLSGLLSIIWHWLNKDTRISADSLARIVSGTIKEGIFAAEKMKNAEIRTE